MKVIFRQGLILQLQLTAEIQTITIWIFHQLTVIYLNPNLWIFHFGPKGRENKLLPDKTMLPDSAVVERSFIERRASYEAFAFL